ncbi:MAG: hypothetical protein GX811_03970 [Lentisphaerae bacterium]|nr:hypothetical protein [Lentisphaerota bacterium]
MYRLRRFCSGILFVIIAFSTFIGAQGALTKKQILLVVPARQRPLQVAFDMRDFKSTLLLSYEQGAQPDQLAIHMWSEASQKWLMLSLDDLQHGDFIVRSPRAVIVVAEHNQLPIPILEAVSRWKDVTVIESIQPAEMLNVFNSAYKFRASEWEWLSKRYGFELEDLNRDVRKFNPYTIPQSQVPRSLPKIDEDPNDIPAAVMEKR